MFEVCMRNIMVQTLALEALNSSLEMVGSQPKSSLADAARAAKSEQIIDVREFHYITKIRIWEGDASKHDRLSRPSEHDRLSRAY